MPVKTVRNVTSLHIKRSVSAAALERVTIETGDPSNNTPQTVVAASENNANILGSNVTPGNPIVYHGFDYIPEGTAQYNANPPA